MTQRQGDMEPRRQSPGRLVTLSPYLGLVIILVIAAVFRFYGLAWDSGYLFHPDERKIMLVVSDLRLPANILEFFSADSPLNPKFFAYGSFPIYLLKIFGLFAPNLSFSVPWREDFVSLTMFGRALSALFDLATIGLVFLLGRRLYDTRVGLVAAACVAVTVLHIQLSHFYTVDTLLTLLIVATMFFAARSAQMGKRRDAVLVGITYGLALATKITALLLIVPIVFVIVKVHYHEDTQTQTIERKNFRAWVTRWRQSIWRVRRTLIEILGIALAAFIITQPYALLDPVRYFGQVGTELLVARGWLDYPYTRQYADTLPFIYPVVQSTVWGMSMPLGIFAWSASALFMWTGWRNRDHALSTLTCLTVNSVEGWQSGFLLSWALIYFLATGAQYAKYLRYVLPLLPFLFLMASAYLSRFMSHASRLVRYASLFIVFGSLLAGLVYSIAFVSMYSREHPWIEISKWIYTHIPPQSTLALEHWDDALPEPMRNTEMGDRSPTEYRTLILPMYDDDNSAKLETLVNVLHQSDYVILATQRLSATITRLSQRYPMSSHYYALLFSGRLGFDLVTSAVNGISLDGILIFDDRFNAMMPPLFSFSDALVWNWGRADESFTVYDHPLPLVFKKTRILSPDELRALLIQ